MLLFLFKLFMIILLFPYMYLCYSTLCYAMHCAVYTLCFLYWFGSYQPIDFDSAAYSLFIDFLLIACASACYWLFTELAEKHKNNLPSYIIKFRREQTHTTPLRYWLRCVSAQHRSYTLSLTGDPCRWQYVCSQHTFSTAAVAPSSSYFMPTNHQMKTVTLSFGPNHPAAHGILKLSVQTQGEVLQRLDPQFGFLHRGTEKLFEHRNYYQNLPYFDRFDYVANLFQEHAFCLAVEDLGFLDTQKSLSPNLQHVRVLFDELSRLLNHLLTMSATCLDLGAMGPIFWAFEERERLMEFYERASGARMHVALYRPFDIDWTPLTASFFSDLARFTLRAGRAISGAVLGLLNNKILKTRLASVGQLSHTKLNSYGITGVIARSAGIRKDLRLQKSLKYGAYSTYAVRSFLGRRGDNLDRFLIRVKESFEVFRTASQVLANLQPLRKNNVVASATNATASVHLRQARGVQTTATLAKTVTSSKPFGLNFNTFLTSINVRSKFTAMEELIQHFKVSSEGCLVAAGISYAGVEGPKGEIGVTLVSAGYTKPYRLKVRTPVSHNMHLIPSMCNGNVFGDFVMSFCSFDIVLGEIDR